MDSGTYKAMTEINDRKAKQNKQKMVAMTVTVKEIAQLQKQVVRQDMVNTKQKAF